MAFAVAGALALVPLVLFNPDFVRSALEAVELLAAGVLPGMAAHAVGRRRRASGWWLAWGWLAGAVAVVGWIVAADRALVWLAALAPLVAVAMAGRLRGRASALLAAATLAAVVLGARGIALRALDAPPRQVLFVGLDAASWDMIDPLRAAGRMPTFDRLIREGARGELATFFPVISPPLWTTIATGLRPERHGIKDFWGNADHVRAKRIWDVADEHGLVSGVLGYLVTWPPVKRNGFLVPGWDAQGTETIPPDLAFLKELEIGEKQNADASVASRVRSVALALRHGATLGTLNRAAGGRLGRLLGLQRPLDYALEGRLLKLDLTTDVFCHLLRTMRLDLASYYYSSIDAIQHEFFKYHAPEGFPDLAPARIAEFKDAIPRVYEETDAALGRILRWAAPGAHVVVVSDHGQRAVKREGAKWYRIRTSRLVEGLGIADAVRVTNIGAEVYVRPAHPGADLGPALDAFRSVVTVADGKPLFRVHAHGTDEASLTVRPDLGDEAAAVRVANAHLKVSEVLDGSERISGEHTDTAIVLLAGPGVREGATLPKGTLADVAPTVLALLGLPVARDLDGQVLRAALHPGALEALGVRSVETYGMPAHVEQVGEGLDARKQQQLRELGYLE